MYIYMYTYIYITFVYIYIYTFIGPFSVSLSIFFNDVLKIIFNV